MSVFLSLANSASSPLSARYRVTGSAGTSQGWRSVSLRPHASVLVPLDLAIGDLPRTERRGGGIAVEEIFGPVMALTAGGWLVNQAEGYSASLEFVSSQRTDGASAGGTGAGAPASSMTLGASGLMFGKPMAANGFPRGLRFIPYGYLRNTTSQMLPVTVMVNLAPGVMGMLGSGDHSSQMLHLRLGPGELFRLPLEQIARLLERRMGLRPGSLEGAMLNWSAEYEGWGGDLLISAGSTDPTGNYVFESMPQMLKASVGLQLPYWNTAHGNDTMYSLWNPGTTTQSVMLTLYSADGMHEYSVPLTLSPGASANLDVAMLRMEGVPDASGDLLPPEVEDGSAMLQPAGAMQPGPDGKIRVPATGPAKMDVVFNVGVFNPATATCCSQCGYCCFYTCPEVASLLELVGASGETALDLENCCGILEDFTLSAIWASGTTSVMTSQGQGGFSGVGVGQSRVTAQAYVETWSASDPYCAGGCRDAYQTGLNYGTVNPVLNITMGLNGSSPSGSPVQNGTENVVLGQQVQLRASYDIAGGTYTGSSWSIGGTTAGGWTPGSSPAPVSSGANPTTVFWTAPGSGEGATFTLDYTDATGNAKTDTATVTFNAAGPTGANVATTLGYWDIGGGWLHFGDNIPSGNLGIVFSASAVPPSGYGNDFEWVQIITARSGTCTAGGVKSDMTFSVPAPGLDTIYPYPPVTSSSTEDNPGEGLFAGETDTTYKVSADMYLLWSSGQSGAIFVPLGYVGWSAYGHASGDPLAVASDSTQSATAFAQSASYPTWVNKLTGDDATCGSNSGSASLSRLASLGRVARPARRSARSTRWEAQLHERLVVETPRRGGDR